MVSEKAFGLFSHRVDILASCRMRLKLRLKWATLSVNIWKSWNRRTVWMCTMYSVQWLRKRKKVWSRSVCGGEKGRDRKWEREREKVEKIALIPIRWYSLFARLIFITFGWFAFFPALGRPTTRRCQLCVCVLTKQIFAFPFSAALCVCAIYSWSTIRVVDSKQTVLLVPAVVIHQNVW